MIKRRQGSPGKLHCSKQAQPNPFGDACRICRLECLKLTEPHPLALQGADAGQNVKNEEASSAVWHRRRQKLQNKQENGQPPKEKELS